MTNQSVQSKILTKAEACQALGGLSLNTLNRRIEDGSLASIKFGRRVFVPSEAIDRLIADAMARAS
jgi:excisionase family DNA binding protein